MTVAPTIIDSELGTLRRNLAVRLNRLRDRLRARLWLDVAVRVVPAVVCLAAISFTLDWLLELSRAARIVYIVASAIAIGTIAARSVLAVRRVRLEPIDLAAELDKVGGRPPSQWIAPRVATVLQLSDSRTREPSFSAPIVERAVRDSARSLDQLDFDRWLNTDYVRQCLIVIAAAIVVPAVFALFMPGEISRLWARRWLLGSTESWPRDTRIEVLGLSDGRLIVPRGEPVTVRVSVFDQRRPTETVWVRLTPQDGPAETSTMSKFGTGDFRWQLPPQPQPARIEFWGNDARTGLVEIVPVDRPRIARMNLDYRHPRDKAPRHDSFTGEEGNVRLLKETRAELTLVANVPISTLDVAADGKAAPKFEQLDERTFRAKWIHQAPLSMRIGMVARDSLLASRPRPITIGLREDRPPQVTLTHGGVGARVTPNALIPLKVTARDDFAILRVALSLKITPTAAQSAEKPEALRTNVGDLPPAVLYDGKSAVSKLPAPEPAFDGDYQWDLQSLKLVPGDTATATALATDDCYTGAQTARSRALAFRVVPVNELFREILLKQQQLRARLRRATEQAEALVEAIRTAALPDDGEEILRRHNLIEREAWQVMHGIEDSATEMRLNRLGGPETYDIITRTIVDPLKRLHEQLLTAQRQSLESIRQPSAETPQQLLARQQQIVATMQKILKNMAQWDSFIDVVNQLNEVIKLEQAVREKTEDLKKKQFESIFDPPPSSR